MLATSAPPPRLDLPAFVTDPCGVSTLQGESEVDLEIAYRARGLDIAECDARRALGVSLHKLEHDLADQMAADRKARNSRLCRWFKLGC